MTESEIATEVAYRREERLAILCGSNQPTLEQAQLAQDEADSWEEDYRASKKGS